MTHKTHKTRRTRVASIALVFTLAACGGSTEPVPVPSGTEVILELGQASRLDGTSITVALREVQDSRCRPDVVCVWEGNGRVVLDLSDAGGPEITGELNTHPTFPRALTFRYVRIELTAVDPLPASGPAASYRAHLRWYYLLD